MAQAIDGTTAGLILEELRDLKANGCRIGATNSANLGNLKDACIQHDKRIVANEKSISGLTQNLGAISDQIATQVIKKANGSLQPPAARTIIPVNAFGIKFDLPASWIGWVIVMVILVFVASVHYRGYSETTKTIEELKRSIQIGIPTNGVANIEAISGKAGV